MLRSRSGCEIRKDVGIRRGGRRGGGAGSAPSKSGVPSFEAALAKRDVQEELPSSTMSARSSATPSVSTASAILDARVPSSLDPNNAVTEILPSWVPPILRIAGGCVGR